MARNSSGVYSLPQAAYVAGTVIASASMNSNLSDIANALTTSLASTGVTPMTGPILSASGTVAAPSITFNSNPATGFYLAGANQIGWAANGSQGATFNNDKSVTWAGNQSIGGTLTVTGTTTHNGASVFAAGQTVTFNGNTFTFGAGAVAALWAGLAANFTIEFVIDGGGIAYVTGQKGHLEVPASCTISRWTMLHDQSSTTTIDIWKTNYAGFPPAIGNTITGSAVPATTAAQNNQSSTLTGWTTALSAGDILAYNASANNNATRTTISLFVIRVNS
jgi:hypothetical protein